MVSKSVLSIRSSVEDSIGENIVFKVKKGKSKALFHEGVIAHAYPSVFTVYVEKRGLRRIMSFNYIDLLTNYVEMFLCDEEQTKIM